MRRRVNLLFGSHIYLDSRMQQGLPCGKQENMRKKVSKIFIMLTRLCWTLALASGVAVMLGARIPVAGHMVLGAVVLLGLLVQMVLGFHLSRVLALVGVVVGALALALGWGQYDPELLGGIAMLPVMAGHLVFAVAAMGLSEAMAKKIRKEGASRG